MAERSFLVDLNLNQNELIQAVIETVGSFPAGARKGRPVYRTDLDELYYCVSSAGDTTQADHWQSAQGGVGGLTAGDGLGLSANDLFVNVDDVTIQISSDTLEVKDGGITSKKLASGAVVTSKISSLAVTSAKLTSDAVVWGKIAASAVSTSELVDGAVTSAKLAAGAVVTSKLADGSVTSNKLATHAVVTDKIADHAVTSSKISAGSVVSSKIGAGAVITDRIADDAVTSSKIADHTITGNQITSGTLALGGNLQVSGDLVILGSKVSMEVTELVVSDAIIQCASNNTSTADLDGGLEVYRGSTRPPARILWDEGDDAWHIGVVGNMAPLGTIRKYVHTQGSPNSTWAAVHNLGTKDITVAVYSGDLQMEAQVATTDTSTCTISLNSTETGRAVILG